MIEIVALSGSLSDTSKNGVTTVGFSNVVNEFLNDDCLSDSGTSEESDLTTSGIWGQHINDFDTCDKNLSA